MEVATGTSPIGLSGFEALRQAFPWRPSWLQKIECDEWGQV